MPRARLVDTCSGFRLPAIAGDLASALQQPDGAVLTRRMARKYFGRDDVVGETI